MSYGSDLHLLRPALRPTPSFHYGDLPTHSFTTEIYRHILSLRRSIDTFTHYTSSHQLTTVFGDETCLRGGGSVFLFTTWSWSEVVSLEEERLTHSLHFNTPVSHQLLGAIGLWRTNLLRGVAASFFLHTGDGRGWFFLFWRWRKPDLEIQRLCSYDLIHC